MPAGFGESEICESGSPADELLPNFINTETESEVAHCIV
jgi:hypothetical protein